jgi:multimeric flavodoxin WrbA
MKALVLNGAPTEKGTVNTVSDYLVDYLKTNNHEVEVMEMRKEKIAPCLGCFSCWLKTPGKCVIKDAGSDLPRKVILSDVLFGLTPVTFGLYSPEFKKTIDRFACPIILPFFTMVNGEFHHVIRYDKNPTFVVFGVLPSSDEESETTFRTLVSRNGINLRTAAFSSIVYSTDKPEVIKEKIVSTLLKAGVQ